MFFIVITRFCTTRSVSERPRAPWSGGMSSCDRTPPLARQRLRLDEEQWLEIGARLAQAASDRSLVRRVAYPMSATYPDAHGRAGVLDTRSSWSEFEPLAVQIGKELPGQSTRPPTQTRTLAFGRARWWPGRRTDTGHGGAERRRRDAKEQLLVRRREQPDIPPSSSRARTNGARSVALGTCRPTLLSVFSAHERCSQLMSAGGSQWLS